MHFLDYHAKIGTGYLHPGGEGLTEYMINEIKLTAQTRLLELGCGTGASIVKIASNYKLNVCACDVSETMINVARQRALFNRVSNRINFVKLEAGSSLPFSDKSFDVVFAESVLAIVDKEELLVLIKEVTRVLVDGGKFVTNDAIWKNTISGEKITQINDACVKDFGMIQSVPKPAVLKEWVEMFETAGLKVDKTINHITIKKRVGFVTDFYTSCRKFFSAFSINLTFNKIVFNSALRGRHKKDAESLDNYLFVMTKRKQHTE